MRKALADAREAYKKQVDKKHIKSKDFNVDDCIYLFTQNLQSWQPLKKIRTQVCGSLSHQTHYQGGVRFAQISLRRIHPVFHCSLLKTKITSPLKSELPHPPEPLMIEGEQHFEVRDILDSCRHWGKFQYLVAWKDFPESQNEWVDQHHVKSTRFLKCFHNQYPDKCK